MMVGCKKEKTVRPHSLFRDWTYIMSRHFRGGFRDHLAVLRYLHMRTSRIRLLADVLRGVAGAVSARFQERLEQHGPRAKEGKYFDLVGHMARAITEARHLGVIDAKVSLRVLDLGTGCGYFPYVCRYLGHKITTIDKQEGKYGYAREQLGVPAHLWEMTPESPLPDLGQQFDLITAFQPVFFLYRPEGFGTPWNEDMWEKFFQRLKPALADGGRFYLGANDMSRVDKSAYQEMLEYFERKKSDRVSDGWLFSKELL
jgi:SAM-dependent methyltransferase